MQAQITPASILLPDSSEDILNLFQCRKKGHHWSSLFKCDVQHNMQKKLIMMELYICAVRFRRKTNAARQEVIY